MAALFFFSLFFPILHILNLCICEVYMPVETAKKCNRLSVVSTQRALFYLFSLFIYFFLFCLLI